MLVGSLFVPKIWSCTTGNGSVTPGAIPEIKQVVRRVSMGACERVAKRALELESARDVRTYLNEELTKALPEVPA